MEYYHCLYRNEKVIESELSKYLMEKQKKFHKRVDENCFKILFYVAEDMLDIIFLETRAPRTWFEKRFMAKGGE
jgi:hypothetical protein